MTNTCDYIMESITEFENSVNESSVMESITEMLHTSPYEGVYEAILFDDDIAMEEENKGNIIKRAINWIKEKLQALWRMVKQFFSNLAGKIRDLFKGNRKSRKETIADLEKELENTKRQMADMAKTVTDTTAEMKEKEKKYKDTISDLRGKYEDEAKTSVKYISDYADSKAKYVALKKEYDNQSKRLEFLKSSLFAQAVANRVIKLPASTFGYIYCEILDVRGGTLRKQMLQLFNSIFNKLLPMRDLLIKKNQIHQILLDTEDLYDQDLQFTVRHEPPRDSEKRAIAEYIDKREDVFTKRWAKDFTKYCKSTMGSMDRIMQSGLATLGDLEKKYNSGNTDEVQAELANARRNIHVLQRFTNDVTRYYNDLLSAYSQLSTIYNDCLHLKGMSVETDADN